MKVSCLQFCLFQNFMPIPSVRFWCYTQLRRFVLGSILLLSPSCPCSRVRGASNLSASNCLHQIYLLKSPSSPSSDCLHQICQSCKVRDVWYRLSVLEEIATALQVNAGPAQSELDRLFTSVSLDAIIAASDLSSQSSAGGSQTSCANSTMYVSTISTITVM